MTAKPKSEFVAFAKTERDASPLSDVEVAMQQVVDHPPKPVTKSENREATTAELNQRWKPARRAKKPALRILLHNSNSFWLGAPRRAIQRLATQETVP